MARRASSHEATVPVAFPGEWAPLADPYVAPDGLVVETVGSVARMAEVAGFFGHPRMLDGFAEGQAAHVARGLEHPFVTLRDGIMQSYGELVVRDGLVTDEYNHGKAAGRRVAEASPKARSAVAAFVGAVNAGLVPLAYDVGDEGFGPRIPGPSP